MKKVNTLIKNKRGQFYLIAAIIVAGLVIGLVGVQNSSQRLESTKVFDVEEELSFESQKVIEYAIDTDGNNILEDFAKDYQKFVGSAINITYITGERGNVDVYYFEDSIQKTMIEGAEEDFVIFTFKKNEYSVNIHKGLNFAFIISEELQQERYVATNF